MNLVLFCQAWAVTAVFFLTVDSIWLGVVAKNFYQENLGFLMRDAVNFPVAAGFYFVLAAAVVYLASWPGFREMDGATAMYAGAVLGLAAYGTYDITNLATVKNWPVPVSVVDLVWGTILTTMASYVGFRALVYFG